MLYIFLKTSIAFSFFPLDIKNLGLSGRKATEIPAIKQGGTEQTSKNICQVCISKTKAKK